MIDFCLIVDDEPSIQSFLTTVLTSAKVACCSCSTVDSMLSALALRRPELIFLDAALEGSDAVDALRGLAQFGYKEAVQLISGRAPDILEELCQFGEEYGLKMLPPLQKPFSAPQIRQILKWKGFVSDGLVEPLLESAEVNPLIGSELWCKPLFDGQRRTLALIEARVRSKVGRFSRHLDGEQNFPADPEELLSILNLCRRQVARFNSSIASVGIPSAVVVPCLVSHLAKINFTSLADTKAIDDASLSWLTVELLEDDVFNDLVLARRVIFQLRVHGAGIRIRNAGTRLSRAGYLNLHVQEVAFAASLMSSGGISNLKRLSKMVEIIKRAGAKSIAPALAESADLMLVVEANFDLYEDPREARLCEPAAFVRKWGRAPAPADKVSLSAAVRYSVDRSV